MLFEDGIKANDSDDSGGRRRISRKPSSSPVPPSLFFTVAMEEDEDHTINIDLDRFDCLAWARRKELHQLPLTSARPFLGHSECEGTPLGILHAIQYNMSVASLRLMMRT